MQNYTVFLHSLQNHKINKLITDKLLCSNSSSNRSLIIFFCATNNQIEESKHSEYMCVIPVLNTSHSWMQVEHFFVDFWEARNADSTVVSRVKKNISYTIKLIKIIKQT